jgi:hypothetical protein
MSEIKFIQEALKASAEDLEESLKKLESAHKTIADLKEVL